MIIVPSLGLKFGAYATAPRLPSHASRLIASIHAFNIRQPKAHPLLAGAIFLREGKFLIFILRSFVGRSVCNNPSSLTSN